MAQESFFDRFVERIDAIDANSRQAYLLHLFRERGFFESVFNTIQEGILVIDRHLRIQYFNLAAKTILGLPEDYRRVRISQLLPQMDWRRILSEDIEAWTRLARQEIEIAYPVHRFVQVYLVPQSDGTKDEGHSEVNSNFATVILRDVSDLRKQSEAELESRTAQVVSMLAGSVAHEIGNPLNSLYLNLQLLHRMFGSEAEFQEEFDRADALEMVDECRDEVERLDKLIGQFLGAVRPGKCVFAEVDLKELMSETLNFMRNEISARSITVECCFPDAMPHISGDGGQLKQAFYNIVKNAIQAMASDGVLRVSGAFDEEFVTLEFADSGKGVNIGELSRMFEPFETFRNGGSGLGMMIIERVVREHGATLLLDTTPGLGLTLTIRFPRLGRRFRMLPDARKQPAVLVADEENS